MITTCLDISTLKEAYVQHNNVELLISIAHHYDSTNESIGSLLRPSYRHLGIATIRNRSKQN